MSRNSDVNNLQHAVMERMIAATGASDPTAAQRIVGTGAVDLIIRHLEHPDVQTYGTRPEEMRNQIMEDTLQAAHTSRAKWKVPILRNERGDHSVVFHNSLESIPQMKPIVDLGPIPRPGDESTINATGGARRGQSVFYQTGGATWRQILDVGEWDNSVMVNSPGESGTRFLMPQMLAPSLTCERIRPRNF
jgi:penicillin amidase